MKITYNPCSDTLLEAMEDRAFGVSFKLKKKDRERFNYQLRKALSALIRVNAAYEGEANRERCDMMVAREIGKKRNTARGLITWLESGKYVAFERKANGVCVVIPKSTLASMRLFKGFRKLIHKVVLAEEGETDIDITADRELLEEQGIYLTMSDDEVNERIRKGIEEAISKPVSP